VAEMSSWATQNSGPTGTLDTRETSHHIGALAYPHSAAMKSKSGFRPGPGASPGLVTATGTPNAFVHVAPFQLLMQNIRGSGLGTYIQCLDAIKDINILSTGADPTNPRNDLIVAQQSDLFDADANSDFTVRHVVGTPGAVPVDPAVSGSTNFVTLARVRVNALATTITSGNITDLRTTGHANSLTGGLYSVASGGVLPVASQAERDALTGLYNGLTVWRQDLLRQQTYTGSAWAETSQARLGCTLRRAAAQTLPDVSNTTVSWDTEDDDIGGLWAIGTPTVITVPANGGGLWAITFSITTAALSTARSLIAVTPSAGVWSGGGATLRNSYGAGEVTCAVAGTIPLAAGDTFTCLVSVDMAAASTMTAILTAYRVGL